MTRTARKALSSPELIPAAVAAPATGGVPSDWPLVALGTLCSFANGVNADRDAYGKGVPFINVLEVITRSHLRASDVPGRVLLSEAAHERFAVRRGDILFNRTSETQEEVGLSAVYDDDDTVVFGGFVIRGRFTVDAFDHTYVGYALRAPTVRSQIIAQGQGAIRVNIGQANLERILVPIPSRHEQCAIADALSDSDRLLGALETLIAKKQAIKQAAMRQLLTCETRLPGFTGAWKKRRVAEIGDVLAGKALDVNGVGTLRPYLRTKNVLDGRIDLEDVLSMPMTDVELERFRIEAGDVLLNEGQSLELVGRCSMYRGELGSPCAMQNQLLRFRAHTGTSAEFAAHVFRHCQRTGVFAAIATQTTSVAHLGSSRLSNLPLLWPSDQQEQAEIAAVLSDMDAEIVALEARRDKTRAIKQAMMQQLLTGRIRLVNPSPAETATA